MLRQLVECFQDRVELPIEIEEIRDSIVNLGIQDKIVFSAEDLDTGTLRGALYQWRESAGVYTDPVWTTLIVYPVNETIERQRVICAKELIHLFDAQVVRTNTPEMVEQLAKKVVGPFETPSTNPSDLMASMDKLAQYQSLNLLLPLAARRLARKKIEAGEVDMAQVSEWAAIPIEETVLVLNDHWDKFSELLIAIGNGEMVVPD